MKPQTKPYGLIKRVVWGARYGSMTLLISMLLQIGAALFIVFRADLIPTSLQVPVLILANFGVAFWFLAFWKIDRDERRLYALMTEAEGIEFQKILRMPRLKQLACLKVFSQKLAGRAIQ